MRAYIIKRLLLMLPTLFGITLISFSIIRLAPGDPAVLKARAGSEGITDQAMAKKIVEQTQRIYGLDKPILLNFKLWTVGKNIDALNEMLKDGDVPFDVKDPLITKIKRAGHGAVYPTMMEFLSGEGSDIFRHDLIDILINRTPLRVVEGWSLDDKTELFTREELVQHFSIERITKAAAIFSHEKLQWMNGVYVRELAQGQLAEAIVPFFERDLPATVPRPISREYVLKMVPLIQERVATLSEASAQFDFFFLSELDYDADLLLGKKGTKEEALASLDAALKRLPGIPFGASSLEESLRSLAEEMGIKAGVLFAPLRVACTGRTATPPLFETMEVLGKDTCLSRIEAAAQKLR